MLIRCDETTDGRAIWHNPTGTLESVLVPKRGLSFPLVFFTFGIIVLAILMVRSLRQV